MGKRQLGGVHKDRVSLLLGWFRASAPRGAPHVAADRVTVARRVEGKRSTGRRLWRVGQNRPAGVRRVPWRTRIRRVRIGRIGVDAAAPKRVSSNGGAGSAQRRRCRLPAGTSWDVFLELGEMLEVTPM